MTHEVEQPVAQMSYFECEREEMLEFLPSQVRTLLEVGCGAGRFGARVRQTRGAEVWGVEPVPEAAAAASLVLDRVITSTFPVDDLPAGYFDAVVFNDVLEHMIDPWTAVRSARDLLTPTGVVVASIPNVRYLQLLYHLLIHGDWKYTPSGALDQTHLRFFTKKSMVRMFEEAGFIVTRIEGLYPYRRWQTTVLEVLLPWFTREAKYIDFGLVAIPRHPQDERRG